VTKDKDVTDEAQVPVSGATVQPYRRGGTASGTATIGTAQTVAMFDVGSIEAGDTLQLASDLIAGSSTPTVTVDSVDSGVQITCTIATGGSMSVAVDDRLVPTNSTPTVYDESSGTSPLASFTTDADGYAEGYVQAHQAVDVLISGGGADSKFYADLDIDVEDHHVNADSFATVQAAIDFAPARSIVHFSSRNYPISTVLSITKSLQFIGEGVGENQAVDDNQQGTTFTVSGSNTGCFSCTTDGIGGLVFKDFRIQGPGTAGTGIGIELNAAASTISSPYFENVIVTAMGSHGIHCDFVDFPYMYKTSCLLNKGDGFRFTGTCTQVRMDHIYSLQNDDAGITCNTVLGFQLAGIGVQDNHQDQTGKTSDTTPELNMNTVHEVSIQRIDFEDFDQLNSDTAIIMQNCRGVHISGNAFVNPLNGGRGIYVERNNDGVFIGPNRFTNVDIGIKIADNAGDALDVSSNMLVMDQGWTTTPTTDFDIPNATDRTDKNIVILSSANGFLPPVYTDASEPAGGSTMWEGAIWYRRDGTNGWFGDDGATQIQLG
jgi:hypothetical protein